VKGTQGVPVTQGSAAAQVNADPIFTLNFKQIRVFPANNLERVTATLFLDDTTNGEQGLGNTCRVRLERSETSPDALCSARSIQWDMQGAYGATPSKSMPLVASLEVTAMCPQINMQQAGPSPAGGMQAASTLSHATVGGCKIHLQDLLNDLIQNQGYYTVPIHNSFVPPAFYQPDGTIIDTRVFNISFICDLDMSSLYAKREQLSSLISAGLFKNSKLPDPFHGMAIQYCCPVVAKEALAAKVQGDAPNTKQAGDDDDPLQDVKEGQDASPTVQTVVQAMAAQMVVPCARMQFLPYPNILSILPGLCNPAEQEAITQKSLHRYGLHSTMVLFSARGWTLSTLMEKVIANELDMSVLSFINANIMTVLSLAGTQTYEFDKNLMPDIAKVGTYSVMDLEDWQVTWTQDDQWDCRTSLGNPARGESSVTSCNPARGDVRQTQCVTCCRHGV